MTLRDGLKIALFSLLGGLCFTLGSVSMGHFGWWWLSGVLITASLVPVLRFGPRTMLVLQLYLLRRLRSGPKGPEIWACFQGVKTPCSLRNRHLQL
jgi:hypothetical protein